jgi:predicted  nucleic acid-binding Zn-ribbon protein
MADVLDAKLDTLDALAARIDRAVLALTRLKDENSRLTARVHELEGKLGDGEKALGGRTLADLLGELDGLKAAEKLWLTERKEIAHRIEELVTKLEKIGE